MSLKRGLEALTRTLADSIFVAIREASLDEILGERRGQARRPERRERAEQLALDLNPKAAATRSRRLPRRSAEDIAQVLNKIVLLVKTHKAGMRAEEIRSKLGLQAKEMPRILKDGLAAKKLTSKGQKRATTYFAKA